MKKTIILLLVIVLSVGLYLLYSDYWDSGKVVPTSSESTADYRIGFVGTSPIIGETFEGFKEDFDKRTSKLGLEIEYYRNMVPYSQLNIENATKDLLEEKVDLIYTGMSEMKIVKSLAGDIPVVVMVGNPNYLGLVGEDNTSDGNLAFVDTTNFDSAGERLRLFNLITPKTKRILVLRGAETAPGENTVALADMQKVASGLGLTLVDKQFEDRKSFNKFMLEPANFADVDAIFRYPSPFIATNIDLLFAFQTSINKPIIGIYEQELEQGATVAYGPDPMEIGALASGLAYDVLVNKKNASDLPYVKPAKLYLGVNDAELLEYGLTISSGGQTKIDYHINKMESD